MTAATEPRELSQGSLGEGVRVIDPLQDHRWDSFVARHPLGWITHLSGWKRVLDRNFPHMRGYYLTLGDASGEIEAALPVYSVRSWLTGSRLISLPFATLCDPLATDPVQVERLLNAVLALSKRLSIRRVEIRTLASSHLLQGADFGAQCLYKHHYLRLCPDPELVMRRFHRSCVRQRLARAEQSGLRLVKASSEEDLKRFYLMYVATRKKRGLPPQPYRLIQSLWQGFRDDGRVELLLCYREEEAVAGVMLLKYKNRVSAEYSASNSAFNAYSPSHFLFWKAIQEACLSGYEVFDFGQTPADNQSLLAFKSHWGTEVRDLLHFIHPNDQAGRPVLHHHPGARKLVSCLCKVAPHRALTCLGEFCYRHLG